MACHPEEVEDITLNSQALALNLGNFDDVRAESMIKSAKIALEHHIPCILDLVGVACSPLRMQYAKKLLLKAKPTVIKGNISECKAFYGLTSHAHGVDADILDVEDVYESAKWLMDLSRSTGCIVVCSGKTDIITDGEKAVCIRNGRAMMGCLTGTGCMLNTNDCFLSGHTHVPTAYQENGIYLLNPGSISLPKENHPRTYAILTDTDFTIYTLDHKEYMKIEF